MHIEPGILSPGKLAQERITAYNEYRTQLEAYLEFVGRARKPFPKSSQIIIDTAKEQLAIRVEGLPLPQVLKEIDRIVYIGNHMEKIVNDL